MCYRPEIHLACCGRSLTAWSRYQDRYAGTWKPPIVEHCAAAVNTKAAGFSCPSGDKLVAYPSAAWSTYPAACPDCERQCIRGGERAAEVRAHIDARFDSYQRTGLRMTRQVKADILRTARVFFRSAFWKRAQQGAYGQRALERVQSWMRRLNEEGPTLGRQSHYATNRPSPMLDLNLETLREEMAAWWPEISADTVMLADLLLQQRVLFQRLGPRDVDDPEIFLVSAAISNLRAKYFDYPGEELKLVDERDDEAAWMVVDGQQGL
ncbi:hypothetical protein C8A01DRAFT_39176 [Parachaetomium inaequale]|uniref:Uncharacterized protein n=1 Tax=Parachaetomium inaequale TaxID=2588326 RepID=A0AAN6P9Q1_9PEZI|nr:hypothetical protein C8A01DRAFT_39176 [Parachaetomium inaequale]